MNKKLDSATIRLQIDNLLAAYPELKDDDILRADMFEGETDLHEYLSALERRRRRAHFNAEGCDAEIKELTEWRDRMQRREQAMRSIMFKVLQWADLPTVDVKTAIVAIRRGSAKVIIENELELPDEFWRVSRSPDKTKIKAALTANPPAVVPGASMSNAEPYLTVRTKLNEPGLD